MSDPTNPSNPYGQAQPEQPYGQQPPAYGQQPPAYGQQPPAPEQPHGAAYGGAYGGGGDKRPGTVTAASIITIIFSVLGLLTFGLLAALVQGSDELFDEVNKQLDDQPGFEDYSTSEILDVITVFLSVFAVWSLLALVLAVLAMRRHNWARILTVVSAVISAVLSLLAIGSGLSAITLVASIAAIVLYFTGGANEWYARKGQATSA